jgi:peptide/nickel transport system permease protein
MSTSTLSTQPRTPLALIYATQFAKDRVALVAVALFVLLLAIAICAPWISPQNPYDLRQLNILDSQLPPGSKTATHTYWLGTDHQGRDVLSAIFYGLRISVIVGISSGILAFAIGTLVGVVAGYVGGRFDALVMRVVDLQLAFPVFLLAVILLALMGRGVDKVIFAIVAAQWARYARTARAAALVESRKEYIEAARCTGLSGFSIVTTQLLRNCLPPVLVLAAVEIAFAISLEATLSFLGLGLPITEPSLGLLISNGYQDLLNGKYWLSVFPGLALLLAISSLNFIGDRLREVLDPRST